MTTRWIWWTISVIAAGILTAAALILNFAHLLGIERVPLIAGAIGARNALTVLAVCAGLIAVTVALLWRGARPLAASVALGLAVCVAASAPIIYARGITDHPPAAAAVGQVRVLSWNTNGDLVAPAVVAERAARARANVVVLPQTDPSQLREYEKAFAAVSLHVRPYRVNDYSELVVFVATSLGEYQAAQAGPNPVTSAVLVPLKADLPTIVAIHAAQPTFHGNDDWNVDLRWVEARCTAPDVVAVGDFNATADSFGGVELGRCVDVAAMSGAASVGTWPTAAPTWLGMPLDHTLTSAGWRAKSFTVITDEDGSGARHRPILAVLERR